MDELLADLSKRVSDLKGLMFLRPTNDGASVEVGDILVELDLELTRLEHQFTEVQDYVRHEKESVEQAEDFLQMAEAQQEYLSEITRNLPSHLPGAPASSSSFAASSSTAPALGASYGSGALSALSGNEERRRSLKKSSGRKLSIKATPIPLMSYMTLDDVDAIPSYQRGRLTMENLNGAIEELNKIMLYKYGVLDAPKMNPSQMKLAKSWRDMETLETREKAMRFFVETDIKNAAGSAIKGDATGRNILQILRTTGRLVEVRGEGLVRYVVVPSSS